MSFQITKELLRSDLPPELKLLAAVMATYANVDGTSCYPSKTGLADSLGSTRRTVQRNVKRLVSLGVLVEDGTVLHDGKWRSRYVVSARTMTPETHGVQQNARTMTPETHGVQQNARTMTPETQLGATPETHNQTSNQREGEKMTKEEVLTEGKDGAAGAALAQEDSMTPNTSPSGATVSSTGVGASPPLHLDAVGVYLDVFSGRVKGMKKEFRKLVLATVADKDRWRGACEWWLDQGYNPFSVEKLLNAYLGRKFQSAAKSSFVFNGKKCYRCGLAMRSPKQQCGCANEYAVFVNVLDIGTKESLDATVELAATLL